MKRFILDIVTGFAAFLIILVALLIILLPMLLGLYIQNPLFFVIYFLYPIYLLGYNINNNI